jgi:hypothetical protein
MEDNLIIKDYYYYEKIARTRYDLTEEENKIISACGGLTYLHNNLIYFGPRIAESRTVSLKCYILCEKNCICGFNNYFRENEPELYNNSTSIVQEESKDVVNIVQEESKDIVNIVQEESKDIVNIVQEEFELKNNYVLKNFFHFTVILLLFIFNS